MIEQEDIKFIEDHIFNFEAVKIGITRGIKIEELQRYEKIYKKYLDEKYILTYWCGSCVFEMMERLIHWYEKEKASQPKETPTKTNKKRHKH